MRRRIRGITFTFLFGSLTLLPACDKSAGTKSGALSPQQARGEKLFRSYCAVCHEESAGAPGSPAMGPKLNDLFKKQSLPSGAPANDERVRSTIQYGKRMMPPFGQVLTEEQIADIISYLHTK